MSAFYLSAVRINRFDRGLLAVIMITAIATGRLNGEEQGLLWFRTAADCEPQLRSHHRVTDAEGHPSERLSVFAKTGTYCHFSTPISAACVIEDFVANVDIRSNRNGIQLLARVVFPATFDANQEPLTVIVRGDSYAGNGSWQQLSINDLPMKVKRAERRLRLQHASNLNLTKPYIDQLSINVYGGPGITTTEIGRVKISGVVDVDSVRNLSGQTSKGPLRARKKSVEIQNGITRIDGVPFFPRIIEHRGEPFDLLAKLGFNTIAVQGQPTQNHLADAERLGMWMVSIDPSPSFFTSIPHPVIGVRLSDSNLQKNVTPQESQILTVVDSSNRFASRPIRLIGIEATQGPDSASQYFSQLASSRRQLDRTSAGYWGYVSTDPSLGNNPQEVDTDLSWANRIRDQSLAAIAVGVRGLWYASSRPLNTNDRSTALRRTGLERLNIEHQLIQPWLVAGRPDQVLVDSGRLRLHAAMSLERAKLLIRFPPQHPPRALVGSPGRKPAIRLAGLSNVRQSYELTLSGLTPIKQVRVAGGISVHPTINQSHVVSTSDPMVLKELKRRIASFGDRPSQLELELARIELELVQVLMRRLDTDSVSAKRHLDSAQAAYATAISHYRSKERRAAHHYFQLARKLVGDLHELVTQIEKAKLEGRVNQNENHRSI